MKRTHGDDTLPMDSTAVATAAGVAAYALLLVLSRWGLLGLHPGWLPTGL